MRKKLTLMFVALMAIAAFATTQIAKRALGEDVFTLTLNGAEVSDPEGFFTHDTSGKFNFNNKFKDAEYDGISFSKGLKMEGTTKVFFTTEKESTVTIVQSTWSANTIKLDDVELAIADAEDGTGCRIYTIEEVAAGDHTIARGSGESGIFYVKVEYVVEPVVEDVVIDEPAAGDLAEAIANATTGQGKIAKSLTLNLKENTAYTLSAPITVSDNLIINGNGATITIADEFTGDVIVLNGTEALAKKADDTDSDHKLINKVEISNVEILGLQGALITDAQKTLLENLIINDAIIEMPASNKNVINFNGKGYVGNVVVKNSTIYANGMNTGFFAQYGSRPKNVNGDWLQTFDIENSTIVNIANGKNICDLKQNGTAQNVYTLKNNIFVDCGKQNQVVVGFNKGQTSSTPVWDVDGNTFLWGGKDVSAAETEKAGKKAEEDIVKNSLPYNEDFGPLFADAYNGDFTIGAGTAQAKMQTGAPQWLVPYDFAQAPEYFIYILEYYGENKEIDVTVPEYYRAGDVYIALVGGTYTLKTPIKAGGGDYFSPDYDGVIYIEGYDGATLDVSELDGPMIQIEGSARNAKNADDTENTNYKYLDYIGINGLNIKGLKQPLVKDNQKTLVEDIYVFDCVIDVNGNKNIFDFNGKGYPGYLAVYNSTLASENGHTGYFLQSGGRVKDLDSEQDTYRQYIDIDGCTLYQIAKGKKMNDLKTTGQKSLGFYLWNSLLYDTGSAGSNTLRGWLGGQLSKNPFVSYANNSYWADDAEATDWYDSTKEGYDKSGTQVYGKPFFRNLVNSTSWYTGDFTLGVCAQMSEQVGDPRWYNVAMIGNLQNALARAASLLFDAQRTWSLVDAENDRIAKLAAAYKDNKPFQMKSNSQEEVNAATARVLAAIAEFLGEDIASDATAIESVNAAKVDNGAWYSISGQRVERPAQKGLYIHNGRKIVVK